MLCSVGQEFTLAVEYTRICSATSAVASIGIKLMFFSAFRNDVPFLWAEFHVSMDSDGGGIVLRLGVALCSHSCPYISISSLLGGLWLGRRDQVAVILYFGEKCCLPLSYWLCLRERDEGRTAKRNV